jgi:ubiquinone/menaquinone biosynthesis C-methylase UbiE
MKSSTVVNENLEHVKCNLCGSDDAKLLFFKWSFNIVQCGKCGLVYVNPRRTQQDLKNHYTEEFFTDCGDRGYNDYIAMESQLKIKFGRKLKRIEEFKRDGRLLDVGCAAGFCLDVAKTSGWEVFGVELSDFASNYARKKGLNVFTGDLTDTDFPDEYFDVVTMWDVIANLTDPNSNLKEVHRILKKGGLVVISTGNINSIFAKFQGINWEILTPTGHNYYFSSMTLSKMLNATGFKIVKTSTHGNITQNERIRRSAGYRYINGFVVKILKLGDVMTVYALKV